MVLEVIKRNSAVFKENCIKSLRKPKKIGRLIWYVFRLALLVGMAYVLLYPMLNMLSRAISLDPEGYSGLGAQAVWIPERMGLTNIKLALTALNYRITLQNTLIMCVVSSVLQMISSSAVGYGFARFRFREKNILFALTLFTIVVPPQTILMPLYIEFRYFDFFGLTRIWSAISGNGVTVNLLNTPWTFWTLSFFGVGLRAGLFILIFRQFFMSMPKDLESAAKIDGCGEYRTFLLVMLPNVTAAFIIVFLFSLVWHWNDYALSSVFFQSRNIPISVYLTKLSSQFDAMNRIDFSTGYELKSVLNAACLLAALPLIILYTFTQKYFVESIDRSGIKG